MLRFEVLLCKIVAFWLSRHAREKIKNTVLHSGLLSFKDSVLIKFYLTADILAATI